MRDDFAVRGFYPRQETGEVLRIGAGAFIANRNIGKRRAGDQPRCLFMSQNILAQPIHIRPRPDKTDINRIIGPFQPRRQIGFCGDQPTRFGKGAHIRHRWLRPARQEAEQCRTLQQITLGGDAIAGAESEIGIGRFNLARMVKCPLGHKAVGEIGAVA